MLHLTKRTRAQVPIACSIEHLERLAIFVNAFCNKALVICCENVQYLWKKRFPCMSKDMKKKKHNFLRDLFKISKIMFHILCVSFWNYALRAESCDFATTHSICRLADPAKQFGQPIC